MFTHQYNVNRSGKAGVEAVTPPPPSRERPSDSQAPRYDGPALLVSDTGSLMTLENAISSTNTTIYVLFCQLVYAAEKTYEITHVGLLETASSTFQWSGKTLATFQFVPLFKAGQGPLASAFSGSTAKVWNANIVSQDYMVSGTMCLRPAYEFLVNDEPAVRRVTEWEAQAPSAVSGSFAMSHLTRGRGSESNTSETYDVAVYERYNVSTSYDHCTPFVTMLKGTSKAGTRRSGVMADLISPIAMVAVGSSVELYWLVLFKLDGQTMLSPRFQKYNNYLAPVDHLDNVNPIVVLLGDNAPSGT